MKAKDFATVALIFLVGYYAILALGNLGKHMFKNDNSALHKCSQYSYITVDPFSGEKLELWNKNLPKDTPLCGDYFIYPGYIQVEFVSGGLYQYWVTDDNGNKTDLLVTQYLANESDGAFVKFYPNPMPVGHCLLTLKTVSEDGIITEKTLLNINYNP